ncbi:DUF2262 domain-containing protein [Paenibacillus sp. WLX2291]|uniref:DUF2262 domain-containing protein n=1 Tax=Paenibacillus sp. WLX2291 TaxID=3296934 RepID=UPI0039841FA7
MDEQQQYKPEEIIQFEAEFAPEVLDVIVLTGSSGFTRSCLFDEQYWTGVISLNGWRLHDQDKIQSGSFTLLVKDEVQVLDNYAQQIKSDRLFHLKVRRNGNRFLLVEWLSEIDPFEDPGLEAMLQEQMEHVSIQDARLGKLTLNRMVQTFDGEMNWLGQPIHISIQQSEGDFIQQQLQMAYRFLDEAAQWDERIRAFAAKELTTLKNNSWLEEDEQPLTEAEFAKRLQLEDITITPEGYSFWFHDNDLFWGHVVSVDGTPEQGLQQAQIAG